MKISAENGKKVKWYTQTMHTEDFKKAVLSGAWLFENMRDMILHKKSFRMKIRYNAEDKSVMIETFAPKESLQDGNRKKTAAPVAKMQGQQSKEEISQDSLENPKPDYLSLAKKFRIPISYAKGHYDTLSKPDAEVGTVQEIKKVWQSEVQTIDFEKVLVVMQGLSRDFVPGGKKRKFMLDYDAEERTVHFLFFIVQEEAQDSRQLETMEMIKFRRFIKSSDDLKGTGLEQTIAFSVQRKSIEKMLESVPCMAEKIRLEKKMRVIVDYDPQEKEIAFRHYEVKTELV